MIFADWLNFTNTKGVHIKLLEVYFFRKNAEPWRTKLYSSATESRLDCRQKEQLDRLCGRNGITDGTNVLKLEIYGKLRQKNDKLRNTPLNL